MEQNIRKANQQLKKEYLGQGPFVYELYGIMIHSGGAYGGHYSAYIKDFESEDRWFHFNDTFVKEISLCDIADVFGQASNPRNRRLAANHANAYMLLYSIVESD